MWEAAQLALKQHSRGGGPTKNRYLLKSRVRCVASNGNMVGQTVHRKGVPYSYFFCQHHSSANRPDPATRCKAPQLPMRKLENWVWGTIMLLAENPEQITAELRRHHLDIEKEQGLARQAIATLKKEIERLKRQKDELLDLYLNRDHTSIVLTRQDFEVKAAQLSTRINEMEMKIIEMQSHLKAPPLNAEQTENAIGLLKAIRLAGEHATFEDKLAIIQLLDIYVLYDGETIELVGGVPTQTADLTEFKRPRAAQNSSLPPQFAPSNGSPEGEEGNSIFSDRTHSTDCTPH